MAVSARPEQLVDFLFLGLFKLGEWLVCLQQSAIHHLMVFTGHGASSNEKWRYRDYTMAAPSHATYNEVRSGNLKRFPLRTLSFCVTIHKAPERCAAADEICVKGVRGCCPDKHFRKIPRERKLTENRIKAPWCPACPVCFPRFSFFQTAYSSLHKWHW